MDPLIFGGLESNDAQIKFDLAGYSVGRRGQPWIVGCDADTAYCWLRGPGKMTSKAAKKAIASCAREFRRRNGVRRGTVESRLIDAGLIQVPGRKPKQSSSAGFDS